MRLTQYVPVQKSSKRTNNLLDPANCSHCVARGARLKLAICLTSTGCHVGQNWRTHLNCITVFNFTLTFKKCTLKKCYDKKTMKAAPKIGLLLGLFLTNPKRLWTRALRLFKGELAHGQSNYCCAAARAVRTMQQNAYSKSKCAWIDVRHALDRNNPATRARGTWQLSLLKSHACAWSHEGRCHPDNT